MTPRKLLVIEDSELLHRMYNLILSRYLKKGDSLLFANNGEEGLNLLHVNPDTSLILLDINMPTMNGIQFLETIRREGRYTNIPVIIVSTEGKERDTIRGLQLGAKAYITKPFQVPNLLRVIEQVLSNGNPS